MGREIVFLFGRYKGRKVRDCTDVGYMEYYVKQLDKKHWQKELVTKLISNYKNLAR